MYPQSLSPVQQVDFALFLIFAFSAVVLFILTTITVYFLWRYHHKRHPVPVDIRGNVTAEVIWTLIPSLMIMGLFYYGWTGYKALRTVPPNAMQVAVTAKMFSWTFTYPGGKSSSYLAVPVGVPVQLNLHSVDVIHSFFVPAFRIKMDTVPGMKTYAWFKAEQEGVYDIYCAEYCGVRHANMLSTVRAMDAAAFAAWVADTGPVSGPAAGKAFLEAQGCFGCHVTGETISPPFEGMYGSTRVVLEGNKERTVKVDEAYLHEAIVDPGKLIVKGYDNIMPPYTDFTEQQMMDIMEYFRSIGDESFINAMPPGMEGHAHEMPGSNGTMSHSMPGDGAPANGSGGAPLGHEMGMPASDGHRMPGDDAVPPRLNGTQGNDAPTPAPRPAAPDANGTGVQHGGHSSLGAAGAVDATPHAARVRWQRMLLQAPQGQAG